MADAGAVTQLLIRWSGGDQAAADELMPLVYNELRRLAAGYLRRERPDHSLQATALVHEAYLRMIDRTSVTMEGRAQFFRLASKLMRNILVDAARKKGATKRGREMHRLPLSEADGISPQQGFDLEALDNALNDLSTNRPRHGRIVEMRFFGGLTIEETAEALGVSHATVEREWNFARAWLRRKLSQ